LLNSGVKYVILGALPFKDPEAILRIQEKFGSGSVIVALDNKDGKVMVEGWKTQPRSRCRRRWRNLPNAVCESS
jgi:phosphoribosylformimino-5-aminoimidazole carboxamide ribonucleotide (ProFAR) isomerase